MMRAASSPSRSDKRKLASMYNLLLDQFDSSFFLDMLYLLDSSRSYDRMKLVCRYYNN
jgi:hypothetical protein